MDRIFMQREEENMCVRLKNGVLESGTLGGCQDPNPLIRSAGQRNNVVLRGRSVLFTFCF